MDQKQLVGLEEIELIEDQTAIVKKAVKQGTDVVYYAPDPDNPKVGYFVKISAIIQVTYRCLESGCSSVVVRRFLRKDILNNHYAKRYKCGTCGGYTRAKLMGVERDIPVVFRERMKQGLEEYLG